MARDLLMLSLRLKLMLVFSMELMAMGPVLAMLVLATMARGLPMLSLRLKLMLVFSMEPMAMVLVLDMLDLDMDILVLDILDMVVMDLDTVLDMDVPSMVKQLIYASKSSKVIFLLFSALL